MTVNFKNTTGKSGRWQPPGWSAVRKAENRRMFLLCVQTVGNAFLVGFAAKGLVMLIDAITNLSFYGRLTFTPVSPAQNHLGIFVLLVPLAGSLLVGLMARFGSRAIGGHGIPEAMEKIIINDSRIAPAMTFLKPLSAAISIGTGGPFGAEGPIIATGGAFGSLTGQWMHISAAERKIVLAAGACAGMAAIFGTPLAAVLLAIELLLFEFSARSIIPVAAACITGATMHHLLFGTDPVFAMNLIPVATGTAVSGFAIIGVLTGIAAVGISRSIYLIEDLFERLPVHWMWWPAIGSLAIGITGYFSPRTMGVGYDNIRDLLTGNLPLTGLFALGFLKFISWAVSLGSGTSGGTLAPLFTIGGALGILFALGINDLFPAMAVDLPTAAIVGMAAMFAGASRALLTSIVFALETTGQPNSLLPLIAGCGSACFISFLLLENTIMTEKISRRGIVAPDRFEPDILSTFTVRHLMSTEVPAEPAAPVVFEDDKAAIAAQLMGKTGTERLAVEKSRNERIRTGSITSVALLAFYSTQKQKQIQRQSPLLTRQLMLRGRRLFLRRRDAVKADRSARE